MEEGTHHTKVVGNSQSDNQSMEESELENSSSNTLRIQKFLKQLNWMDCQIKNLDTTIILE